MEKIIGYIIAILVIAGTVAFWGCMLVLGIYSLGTH